MGMVCAHGGMGWAGAFVATWRAASRPKHRGQAGGGIFAYGE